MEWPLQRCSPCALLIFFSVPGEDILISLGFLDLCTFNPLNLRSAFSDALHLLVFYLLPLTFFVVLLMTDGCHCHLMFYRKQSRKLCHWVA